MRWPENAMVLFFLGWKGKVSTLGGDIVPAKRDFLLCKKASKESGEGMTLLPCNSALLHRT